MGRHREFDEEALLGHVMGAFWSLGFRGTSIEELVTGSGVSRASLYNAFPDKRALFIESLRRYLDEVVEQNVRRLEAVEPAAAAVREFFEALAGAPVERLRRGCLLTNTAAELGLNDPEAAALIRQALLRVEDTLYRRVLAARRAGDFARGIGARAYARQLITLLQGMRVMARVDVDRAVLKDAVKAALYPLRPLARGRRLR